MTEPASLTDPDSQSRIKRLVESATFRNFILGVILFNAVILGLETSKTVMGKMGPLIETLDTVCLGIFVMELLLKLFVPVCLLHTPGADDQNGLCRNIRKYPLFGGFHV